MLEAGASEVYRLHKKIPEAHRAEEYAREMAKAIEKVNQAFD